MIVYRIIYPVNSGEKLMRIFDVAPTDTLAYPNSCTKIMPEDWANGVACVGGVEQE